MKRFWLKLIVVLLVAVLVALIALAFIELPVAEQTFEKDVTGAIAR